MTSDAERRSARVRLSDDPQGIVVLHRADEELIDPAIRESTPDEVPAIWPTPLDSPPRTRSPGPWLGPGLLCVRGSIAITGAWRIGPHSQR